MLRSIYLTLQLVLIVSVLMTEAHIVQSTIAIHLLGHASQGSSTYAPRSNLRFLRAQAMG